MCPGVSFPSSGAPQLPLGLTARLQRLDLRVPVEYHRILLEPPVFLSLLWVRRLYRRDRPQSAEDVAEVGAGAADLLLELHRLESPIPEIGHHRQNELHHVLCR